MPVPTAIALGRAGRVRRGRASVPRVGSRAEYHVSGAGTNDRDQYQDLYLSTLQYPPSAVETPAGGQRRAVGCSRLGVHHGLTGCTAAAGGCARRGARPDTGLDTADLLGAATRGAGGLAATGGLATAAAASPTASSSTAIAVAGVEGQDAERVDSLYSDRE